MIGLELMVEAADAASVIQTICVDEDTDYTDASAGNQFTGTSNDAYGIHLKISDLTASTSAWVWALTSTGCYTGVADDSHSYKIEAATTAQIVDTYTNTIYVQDKDGNTLVTTLVNNFTPHNGTNNYSIGPSSYVDILAATSFALKSHTGIISGQSFYFRYDSDGTHGNDYRADLGFGWIKEADLKFVDAHEFGHQIFDAANGWDGNNKNYTADLDDCSGAYSAVQDKHQMNSKEFSSTGAIEGVASFYAALAFNSDGSNAACSYANYNGHNLVDWDPNTSSPNNQKSDDAQYLSVQDVFNCEDGWTYSEGGVDKYTVNAADFLGQNCLNNGAVNHRATQYDFVRAFWDFHTDSGSSVSLSNIMTMWANADPDTWNAAGTGTSSDFPATRLQTAATGLSLSTWNNKAATNGTDR